MTGHDPLYVAALAREIRDADYVHVGAQQDDVWAAVGLARALWAPAVRVVAAGTFLLDRSAALSRDVGRTYARDVVSTRAASFHQTRVFDDLRRGRVSFAGGIQVDRRGNANLVGVYQDGRVKVRGPGSGGLPTLTSHTDRFFIAVRHHTPRVLVEEASRISVLGDPAARAAVGLPANALQAVITPLARFEPTSEGLKLTEVAPEVTVDEVQDRTGFAVETLGELRIRQQLSDNERALLIQLLNRHNESDDRNAR